MIEKYVLNYWMKIYLSKVVGAFIEGFQGRVGGMVSRKVETVFRGIVEEL